MLHMQLLVCGSKMESRSHPRIEIGDEEAMGSLESVEKAEGKAILNSHSAGASMAVGFLSLWAGHGTRKELWRSSCLFQVREGRCHQLLPFL